MINYNMMRQTWRKPSSTTKPRDVQPVKLGHKVKKAPELKATEILTSRSQ